MHTIIEYLRAVMATCDLEKQDVEARVKELQAEGYRIIDGGSGSVNEDGSVTLFDDPAAAEMDYFTGEVVTPHGSTRREWPDNWYHIDAIHDELNAPYHAVPPVGMSKQLADDLETLVWGNEDEIRALFDKDEK